VAVGVHRVGGDPALTAQRHGKVVISILGPVGCRTARRRHLAALTSFGALSQEHLLPSTSSPEPQRLHREACSDPDRVLTVSSVRVGTLVGDRWRESEIDNGL
jgi:hypothetical protein